MPPPGLAEIGEMFQRCALNDDRLWTQDRRIHRQQGDRIQQ